MNKCIIGGVDSDLYKSSIVGDMNEINILDETVQLDKVYISLNGNNNKILLGGRLSENLK